MGLKWLKTIGRDWVTDMDVLFDFPIGKDRELLAYRCYVQTRTD